MIARSLIFGAGIFLLYNLALLGIKPLRERYATQSDWQVNLIKVQEFPAAHTAKPGVIVGSSLAARLAQTALDSEFYNLALVSDGPFTGIEVLRNHRSSPRVLLIETNLLMRDENGAMLDNAFRPVISQLRPWLPALRERYQPSNFIAGKFGERVLHRTFRTIGRYLPAGSSPSSPAANGNRARELFAAGLANQQAETDTALDPVQVERNVRKLRDHVSDFERRGTRCIFIEMPTDASLMNLRQPRQIRAALLQAFPEEGYLWIKPDQNHSYLTTDGAHLTESEAKAYALRIRQEIARAGTMVSSTGDIRRRN